ncbi:MAG: replication-relaxation family protein [Cyanobacteria bacterium]|nr:replication-relaxation family protein [Cyanobacteriota bacterium]
MSKKKVTNKEKEIQLLIYTFRFINSKQIQQFLNHKDHRRINGWLKDLVDKGYVERDYKPIYGILTKPAVFNLTALGRKYIKHSFKYFTPKYLKRIARDSKASKAFKIKCQIVADWYLALFHSANNINKDVQVINKTNSNTKIDILNNLTDLLSTGKDMEIKKIPLNKLQFFTPSHYPSFLLLDKIKPDAYLRKKTKKGIVHGFLFVLDAYIPRLMLQYSVKRIFDTLYEEHWEEDSIKSLNFFFLCPNNKIIIYFKRLLPSFLEKYYDSKILTFNFATRNQLYNWKNGKAEKIKWFSLVSTNY